jgi:hypothetical protein
MAYDYCKLFIKSDISFSDLKNTVAQALALPIEGRTVETPSMIVDCFVNSDRDSAGNEGFLHWPFYLEIEAAVPPGGSRFISAVQAFINDLRSRSMRVAPSCDFEDQLAS